MFQISTFIVTCCGVGKIKYAPGTMGSIIAFPLAYMLMLIITVFDINFFSSFTSLYIIEQQTLSILALIAVITILLFIIGIIASNIYMKKHGKHDPQEIVIDEVVGQLIVISLSLFTLPIAHYSGLTRYLTTMQIDWLCLVILPFVFFRLFDIMKPWPINWLDKNIDGGLGVMLDDVLAAVFATVAHYALLLTIADLLSE